MKLFGLLALLSLSLNALALDVKKIPVCTDSTTTLDVANELYGSFHSKKVAARKVVIGTEGFEVIPNVFKRNNKAMTAEELIKKGFCKIQSSLSLKGNATQSDKVGLKIDLVNIKSTRALKSSEKISLVVLSDGQTLSYRFHAGGYVSVLRVPLSGAWFSHKGLLIAE
jgi:hypothetical protein